MKSMLSLALILFAAPALAGSAEVLRVTKGARVGTPLPSVASLRVDDAARHDLEAPVPAVRFLKAATLNCENDGDIAGALEIGIGDFAGNVFDPPASPSPWKIEEISFALFDLEATYPAVVFFDIYEEDAQGVFQPQWSLDIQINGIADQVDNFTLDLTGFDMQGTNAILTLYGDGGGEVGRVLPAYDSTARCYDGTNVCSVHLPTGEDGLFIYGVVDATVCPTAPSNILNLDLVHEITLGSTTVTTSRETWGAVKQRF